MSLYRTIGPTLVLFVNRFSKFLWHFLRHMECKRMTNHISELVFKNMVIRKRQFPNDGVSRVDLFHKFDNQNHTRYVAIKYPNSSLQ